MAKTTTLRHNGKEILSYNEDFFRPKLRDKLAEAMRQGSERALNKLKYTSKESGYDNYIGVQSEVGYAKYNSPTKHQKDAWRRYIENRGQGEKLQLVFRNDAQNKSRQSYSKYIYDPSTKVAKALGITQQVIDNFKEQLKEDVSNSVSNALKGLK